MADVGRNDWILAQITSNSYGDSMAIAIKDADLDAGSLRAESYVRPGKLFTANASLIVSQVAQLSPDAFDSVVDAVVRMLRP